MDELRRELPRQRATLVFGLASLCAGLLLFSSAESPYRG